MARIVCGAHSSVPSHWLSGVGVVWASGGRVDLEPNHHQPTRHPERPATRDTPEGYTARSSRPPSRVRPHRWLTTSSVRSPAATRKWLENDSPKEVELRTQLTDEGGTGEGQRQEQTNQTDLSLFMMSYVASQTSGCASRSPLIFGLSRLRPAWAVLSRPILSRSAGQLSASGDSSSCPRFPAARLASPPPRIESDWKVSLASPDQP